MTIHLDIAEPAGWYLYRFKTRIVCALGAGCQRRHPLYIGISNEPWRREKEHQRDKPWHRHASGWEVDERQFATEEDARAAERAAIWDELPLANDTHNEGNEHRRAFPKVPAAKPATRKPAARRWRWTPQRRRLAAVGGVWAALLGAGWWAGVAVGLPVMTAPLNGGVAASALMLAAWVQTRPRRGRRAFGRHLGTWAVVVAVVYELWSIGSVMAATAGAAAPH